MQCSLCGTELPVGVAYCPICGTVTPYKILAWSLMASLVITQLR